MGWQKHQYSSNLIKKAIRTNKTYLMWRCAVEYLAAVRAAGNSRALWLRFHISKSTLRHPYAMDGASSSSHWESLENWIFVLFGHHTCFLSIQFDLCSKWQGYYELTIQFAETCNDISNIGCIYATKTHGNVNKALARKTFFEKHIRWANKPAY